jgi:hypothetical protein
MGGVWKNTPTIQARLKAAPLPARSSIFAAGCVSTHAVVGVVARPVFTPALFLNAKGTV